MTQTRIDPATVPVYVIYMPKTIRDYLPQKTKPKKTMVQARIHAPIVTQVKKIMKDEGLSWADVVTACLSHFIDDRAEAQKKSA